MSRSYRDESKHAAESEAGYLYRFYGKEEAIKRAERSRDNALGMATIAHYIAVISELNSKEVTP